MNGAIVLFRAVALAAIAVVIWLIWAQAQYGGQNGCPWDRSVWQAWLAGVLLAAAAGSVSGVWDRLQGASGPAVAGVIILGGMIAGIGILIAATFFGAGMHCTD